MLPVTLLDYGVGNIHSLKKAFERAGASVSVETDPDRILKARVLLLPGVGAFGKVAAQVAPFRAELRARLEEGLPAFAVCIGMQILYESSEEGEGEGLGFFPGRVRRLRHARLPHIGWNTVDHRGTGPFEGTPAGAAFYFVHSYAPSECSEPCVATADYGGRFAAAAARANVWAVQFHPEKSSRAGLELIDRFVRFAGERA
ncbi:MAG TPA: imidazole glycerol phosphate synthase subunit HisH [Planctomycetota bacterium]|jgi:glutamine amidotransferase|nr:imidazole glycerol phosphate synthase subunit HisH [Planctomycetota bacterium]